MQVRPEYRADPPARHLTPDILATAEVRPGAGHLGLPGDKRGSLCDNRTFRTWPSSPCCCIAGITLPTPLPKPLPSMPDRIPGTVRLSMRIFLYPARLRGNRAGNPNYDRGVVSMVATR